MKPSILAKLEALAERYEEVQHLLSDANTLSDQDKFRALSKEYSQLEEVIACFNGYKQAQEDLDSACEMAQDDDAELRELAQDEITAAKLSIDEATTKLQLLLLP
ncbi:MAG: PCRF domain-containing protein, partial [Enterovibrio sp.]